MVASWGCSHDLINETVVLRCSWNKRKHSLLKIIFLSKSEIYINKENNKKSKNKKKYIKSTWYLSSFWSLVNFYYILSKTNQKVCDDLFMSMSDYCWRVEKKHF